MIEHVGGSYGRYYMSIVKKYLVRGVKNLHDACRPSMRWRRGIGEYFEIKRN